MAKRDRKKKQPKSHKLTKVTQVKTPRQAIIGSFPPGIEGHIGQDDEPPPSSMPAPPVEDYRPRFERHVLARHIAAGWEEAEVRAELLPRSGGSYADPLIRNAWREWTEAIVGAPLPLTPLQGLVVTLSDTEQPPVVLGQKDTFTVNMAQIGIRFSVTYDGKGIGLDVGPLDARAEGQ